MYNSSFDKSVPPPVSMGGRKLTEASWIGTIPWRVMALLLLSLLELIDLPRGHWKKVRPLPSSENKGRLSPIPASRVMSSMVVFF
jgi:hypothetical protein